MFNLLRLAPAALLALALIVSAAGTLRADDPPAWQDVTPAFPDGADTPYGGVDFGNGIFVAVGTTKAAAPNFQSLAVTFTSTDGVNWRASAQTFFTLGRIRFASGRFFLLGLDFANPGAGLQIFNSTDGVRWAGTAAPAGVGGLKDIAVNNGVVVATTAGGTTIVSTDTTHWQAVTLPDGSTAKFFGLDAGAGQFVFVDITAKLHTSPDGRTLSPQNGLDAYGGFNFLAYGNNTFLANGFNKDKVLSEGDTQLLSPDAGTWTKASPGLLQRTSPTYAKIYFARFLNGNFVALSYDGPKPVISASADAKNWTKLTVLTNDQGSGAFDLAYGAGNYVYMSSKHLYRGVAGGGITPPPTGSGHPAFFNGEAALGNGVFYLQFPGGSPFGYYSYLADPHYIYHQDLGYEYVFEAADGRDGVFLFDFKSGGFFYTSPSFPFPYLYDFSLNAVLYYFPDPKNPGRYNTDGVRYFSNLTTGQIISK